VLERRGGKIGDTDVEDGRKGCERRRGKRGEIGGEGICPLHPQVRRSHFSTGSQV